MKLSEFRKICMSSVSHETIPVIEGIHINRIDYSEGPTLVFQKHHEKKGRKSYFLLADYHPKENKWTFK